MGRPEGRAQEILVRANAAKEALREIPDAEQKDFDADGTAKANSDPGPGLAHDFDCTHDPCVCGREADEPLRTLRAAAELSPRELTEELHANGGRLPTRVSTSLRFPPDLHEALTKAAKERGLSFNFLVVAAVREFLDRLLPADEIRYTKAAE